jgi:hypothetical protein
MTLYLEPIGPQPEIITLPGHWPWECGTSGAVAGKSKTQLIIEEVLTKRGVSWGEIISDRKSWLIVRARQELMSRMNKEIGMTYSQIARKLNRACHTTVMHGIRQHDAWMRGERYIRAEYKSYDLASFFDKRRETAASKLNSRKGGQ